MTILYAGGEMGALVPSDANVGEDTIAISGSGASYDSNFARCSLNCVTDLSYALTPELAAAEDDIWIHFDVDQHSNLSGSDQKTLVEMLDSAGVAKFRLLSAWAAGTWKLQYHNGVSWADLGSQFSASGGSLQTVDIHIISNTASGSAKVYLSGTERSSGTADLSAISGVAQLKFYGLTYAVAGIFAFSQIIMATGETTIGMRLMTVVPSGTGASDQWTNTYAAVDEIAYSDSDFIFSDTANQVELVTGTPVGSMTGYTVRAVAVTARANTDGTGPSNIQLAVRTGSTNYFSSSQALDVAYGAHVAIWETNPNTTIDWTTADIATLQFGVKSIA